MLTWTEPRTWASASASKSTGGAAGGQPAESPSSTPVQLVVKPAAQQSESLPVTGVNVGYLAGSALLLVGAGVGMFWAARRRREV